MKIRIDSQGYENFTGFMGVVQFNDGVSEEISAAEAKRLGALVSVIDVETGKGVGPQYDYDAVYNVPAPVEVALTQSDAVAEAGDPDVEEVAPAKFTQEDLEQIADAKGINGLREVADAFGVKATSIAKLIEGILAAQGA